MLNILDSSSDDGNEEEFYDAVFQIIARDALQKVEDINTTLRNNNGSIRRVNRIDYRRRRKQAKSTDPWRDINWLRMISDPLTQNPSEIKGKEFRRMFRTPYPVFDAIVTKCRSMTDEPEFNYESKAVCDTVPIPLE